MRIGMIGLGRMGGNMAERLVRNGHEVVGFDFSADAVARHTALGGQGAGSVEELASKLTAPRAVWVMVPAGGPVDRTIEALQPHLEAGDVVIDGGNSMYKDTLRRAEALAKAGIGYVDVGTSGGVWGLEEGYSLMVGGEESVVERLRPLFKALAPAEDKGWGRVGPVGAGHFVKMVHNGIEYGMMQAFAEGMAVMEKKKSFGLDLHQIAEIWRHGSVVRSWLLDLITRALSENPSLEGVVPYVSDSGEGRWTVAEAIEVDVAAPVITLSLLARLRSRDTDSFSDKMLAVMREQFGGHAVKRKARQ